MPRPTLRAILICSWGWLGFAAACSDDGDASSGTEGDTLGATGGATEGATEGATSATGEPGDDGTSGPPAPDMGLQPPSACATMCSTRAGCGDGEIACLNQCDADHGTFTETGGDCIADFEALLECLGALSCEDLAAHDDPAGMDAYPCAAEDDAFTTSCLLGGEPPPATCEAYCGVIVECADVPPNECDAICSMQLQFAEGLGKECVDATAAQLDCVGTLDCEGYAAFDLQEGEYPCMAETDTVADLCGM